MDDRFDAFDDPSPPVPGPDERAAVAARAARIRRRRRAYAVSGGALAAVALLGLGMRTGDPGRAELTTRPPSASPEPTPTPTPTAGAGTPAPTSPTTRQPSRTPSATPSPARTPSPRPSATPTRPAPPASPLPTYTTPSGSPPPRHSWSGGFTNCAVEDPGQSTAPADGLTLRLQLPAKSVRAGERIEAALLVTNSTNAAVRFMATQPKEEDGTLVAPSGWAASARTGTDAIGNWEVELAPGETERIAVAIRTESCGSADHSYEPLPPGDYQATAELNWRSGETSGHWWSPLVPVTLVP